MTDVAKNERGANGIAELFTPGTLHSDQKRTGGPLDCVRANNLLSWESATTVITTSLETIRRRVLQTNVKK
jgi:hypothetical protein